MRTRLRLSFLALALLWASGPGCSPGLGSSTRCAMGEAPIPPGTIPVVPRCPSACDPEAARTVVYDLSGFPLYAGQALVLQSCTGTGGVCHAVDAADRMGAPVGLDFDLFPISDASDAEQLTTLARAQRTIFDQRNLIWAQVAAGAMPPGAAGAETVARDFGYVTDPLDPGSDVVLAQLDTPEGREILRNWLACGAPLIQGWVEVSPLPCMTDADCAPPRRCDISLYECDAVGDTFPIIGRTAPMP